MVYPPTSPPAAKRFRLDPEQNFSTLPPSPSASSPRRTNGHLIGDSSPLPPPATTAPPPSEAVRSATNVIDDDEPEQAALPEEEDLSRRDMYLDTVRHIALFLLSPLTLRRSRGRFLTLTLRDYAQNR